MPKQGAFVYWFDGSVGATAVELFMHPYWLREKGYPGSVGPFYLNALTEERYRGWMQVLGQMLVYFYRLLIIHAPITFWELCLSRLEVIPSGVGVVDQVSLILQRLWVRC